jgi:hypothetical protein
MKFNYFFYYFVFVSILTIYFNFFLLIPEPFYKSIAPQSLELMDQFYTVLHTSYTSTPLLALHVVNFTLHTEIYL